MIHSFDEFEFDAVKLELRRAGRPLKADALLLRLLSVLVQRPGDLVTKQEIVSAVWADRAISDNALSVSMARLRKLLGHQRSEREIVVNVHGRGYRFVRPVTPRDTQLAPPLSASSLGRVGAPFVGRAYALQTVRQALEEAHSGSGSFCVLSGEAGIGKTRAVEIAAREAAAAGWPVAWGRCREEGDAPALWPLVQLLRELMARAGLELGAAPLSRLAPELARLLPELAPEGIAAVGCVADSPASRHRSHDAIARVLAHAAASRPCLLILDDLHRADPATQEFLRYFVDEVASTRVVLALTLRTSGREPQLDYVLGHRNTRRIALPRLREEEVASYLTALLGEAQPEVASALYKKSEGNPFFMTELARQLQEQNWPDSSHLTLPYVALDLVRQRVARLDAAARGALSHAAVIGRHFSLSVLQAVTGRDAGTLIHNLDHALASELLVRDPSSTMHFAFSHELLREVLYEGLSPAQRRESHLCVARALEQRVAAGDVVPAAELAYHFRCALPAGDPRKVVEYSGQATNDAARVYAYADAARHLQHAIAALDMLEQGNPRLRVRLLLNQALLARSHSSLQFEPLIREVISAARAQGLGVQLAHAGLLLDPYRGFPGASDSREVLEEALLLLPEGDLGNRAAVLARLSGIPPLAYDRASSYERLAQARQLAEASQYPLGLYNVRMTELYLKSAPYARRESTEIMREIEALCRLPGLSMTVQTVLLEAHRAISALQDGELPGMDAALERGEARARQIDADLLWQFLRLRAIARINAGDRAGGADALRALEQRERPGRAFASDLWCAYDACVVLGEPERLPRAVLLECFAADPTDPPSVWALKLRALTATGLMAEARSALWDVKASRLEALPHDRDYLGTLGALTRTALSLNASEYLEALEPLLTPHADRFAANLSFFCEGSVQQLLGLIAARRGRRDEALERLTQGLHACERAGLRAAAAQARLELSLCRAGAATRELTAEPSRGDRA